MPTPLVYPVRKTYVLGIKAQPWSVFVLDKVEAWHAGQHLGCIWLHDRCTSAVVSSLIHRSYQKKWGSNSINFNAVCMIERLHVLSFSSLQLNRSWFDVIRVTEGRGRAIEGVTERESQRERNNNKVTTCLFRWACLDLFQRCSLMMFKFAGKYRILTSTDSKTFPHAQSFSGQL